MKRKKKLPDPSAIRSSYAGEYYNYEAKGLKTIKPIKINISTPKDPLKNTWTKD